MTGWDLFAQYWKLPDGFLNGLPLADGHKLTRDEAALPVEIDEVIRFFQLEVYQSQSSAVSEYLDLTRRIYYLLRPLIPRTIQITFRKLLASIQARQSFPAWPIDFSLDDLYMSTLILLMQASNIQELPFIWFWPHSCVSCAVITHDVEMQVGHDHINQIAVLDEKYGFRSLWNFVPERYQVDRDLLKDLSARGHEIGLHGLYHDGKLFNSKKVFLSRVERINRYLQDWDSVAIRSPSAIRNLKWIAEHINVSYDTSCPNSEIYAPQPGGCCSVFPFMVNGMVELPFTLPQDHTLFTILKGKGDYRQIWMQVASRIIERHGLVNIIVHPDYMVDDLSLGYYEVFLSWLSEQKNCWFALPRDVAAWWRNRSEQSLSSSLNSWQISGPMADQAHIALVKLRDSQLQFTQYVKKI